MRIIEQVYHVACDDLIKGFVLAVDVGDIGFSQNNIFKSEAVFLCLFEHTDREIGRNYLFAGGCNALGYHTRSAGKLKHYIIALHAGCDLEGDLPVHVAVVYVFKDIVNA